MEFIVCSQVAYFNRVMPFFLMKPVSFVLAIDSVEVNLFYCFRLKGEEAIIEHRVILLPLGI